MTEIPNFAVKPAPPLIALPEARELATLSRLLLRRGMAVLEVPLVAILDAPDPQPVNDWLQRFIGTPPDLLILLTGEGLRRLLSQAERMQWRQAFIAALAGVPTLCRGPKPEKVLRELGLQPTFSAAIATSAGVLAMAQSLGLAGKRIGLQLYGEEPNPLLVNGLQAEAAVVDSVAPYVYASKEHEDRVVGFIETLSRGEVSAVAFTSMSQYKRLADVAHQRGLVDALDTGLRKVVLAAVGPLVKQQLETAGYSVHVMPERTYFMKPLVTTLVRYLQQQEES